jgi:hypothetical protein
MITEVELRNENPNFLNPSNTHQNLLVSRLPVPGTLILEREIDETREYK